MGGRNGKTCWWRGVPCESNWKTLFLRVIFHAWPTKTDSLHNTGHVTAHRRIRELHRMNPFTEYHELLTLNIAVLSHHISAPAIEFQHRSQSRPFISLCGRPALSTANRCAGILPSAASLLIYLASVCLASVCSPQLQLAISRTRCPSISSTLCIP